MHSPSAEEAHHVGLLVWVLLVTPPGRDVLEGVDDESFHGIETLLAVSFDACLKLGGVTTSTLEPSFSDSACIYVEVCPWDYPVAFLRWLDALHTMPHYRDDWLLRFHDSPLFKWIYLR